MGDKRKDGGFVKVHRSITKWEWFDNAEALRLWITLLCLANYQPSRECGEKVRRGQCLITISGLAKDINRSRVFVSKTLNSFVSTGEILKEQKGRATLITILKYDQYQGVNGGLQIENKVYTAVNTSVNGGLHNCKRRFTHRRPKPLKYQRSKALEEYKKEELKKEEERKDNRETLNALVNKAFKTVEGWSK